LTDFGLALARVMLNQIELPNIIGQDQLNMSVAPGVAANQPRCDRLRRSATMTNRLIRSWPLTALRGVGALILALLCLDRAVALKIGSTRATDVFTIYIFADSVLCGLIVTGARGRWGNILLVLASAVCVGGAWFALPHAALEPLSILGLTAWGLAVGLVGLNGGYALRSSVPGPRQVLMQATGVRLRRGPTTEYGMLLVGAVALVFTAIILGLTAEHASISLSLIALFAAVFGFLNLRTGLALGLLAYSKTEANRRSIPNVAIPYREEWRTRDGADY
jgi:hypothetical protein